MKTQRREVGNPACGLAAAVSAWGTGNQVGATILRTRKATQLTWTFRGGRSVREVASARERSRAHPVDFLADGAWSPSLVMEAGCPELESSCNELTCTFKTIVQFLFPNNPVSELPTNACRVYV